MDSQGELTFSLQPNQVILVTYFVHLVVAMVTHTRKGLGLGLRLRGGVFTVGMKGERERDRE